MSEYDTLSDDHRLQEGRAYYAKQRWADAFEAFRRADASGSVPTEDLDRFAWSAALIGRNGEFLSILKRLHQVHLQAENWRLAARAAFWSGFHLISQGSTGTAMGWFARAHRHLEHEDTACPERGYLLLPDVYRHLSAGDDAAAAALAEEAVTIGLACQDADLSALAGNLQGRALLRQGRVNAGLRMLDESMLAVTAEQVSPLVHGIVYCSTIDTCRQMSIMDRAHEWTLELARWCDGQPQLVTFTGICLLRRAEVMQFGGQWTEATEEVRQVYEDASERGDPEVFGEACYQKAELHRLRGDMSEAEAAYREASQHGYEPQPGFSLLRLAQGRRQEAARAIARVLQTTTPAWKRARILPAYVDISLAAGNTEDARVAADELDQMAQTFGTKILSAMAAHTRGALLLAEGDAKASVEPLRHAFREWQRAGAPYICARIRLLLSRACRILGDVEAAALEGDAARRIFDQLGAKLDLAELDVLEQRAGPVRRHSLSARELEVLRLVARGHTNKTIARQLGVSERTIDRHVGNIFTKIDVPSRAAATAFAYEHGLL